jgi:hypothetical protein
VWNARVGKAVRTRGFHKAVRSDFGGYAQIQRRRWNQRESVLTHRWIGTAPLEIEPKRRRVRGCRHLMALREALQKYLGFSKRQAAA